MATWSSRLPAYAASTPVEIVLGGWMENSVALYTGYKSVVRRKRIHQDASLTLAFLEYPLQLAT